GTKSKTLPDYVKENDVICFTCYNAIIVNASSEFQKHALDSCSHIEAEISNQPTFFLSQLNLGNVVESDNSTPEDDDNDTKESADSISALWDNTIWQFLLL
ncbi:32541_t:CDS:2, partial [Gigaspora margarita]